MKTSKWIFVLLLLGFITQACETVIEVPLPEHEPKLVLNARLNPFNNRMSVSRSRGRTDIITEEMSQIDDATSYLFENDILLDTFTYYQRVDTVYNDDSTDFRVYSDRFYTYPKTPWQAGSTYRVEVMHPDYPTASAETYMNHVPTLLSLEIEQDVAQGKEGLSLAGVKVRLQDPPGEENYFNYSIQIKYSHPDSLQDTLDFLLIPFETDGSLRAEIEEFVDLDDILGDINSFWSFFPYSSDEGRDGQILEIDALMYQPSPGFSGSILNPQNAQPGASVPEYVIHSAVIGISCPSKDLYLYQSQYVLHRQNQGVNLSSLIGEPLILHSNVENGYGILGISNYGYFEVTF
ncbi:MAG: DUF4249 family protein [Bacteroidia bacterium]